MNRLFVTILIFVSSYAFSYDLTVVIKGLEPRGGLLSIALFNNEDDWLKEKREFRGVTINQTSDSVTYTFTDLPEGRYGITVLHDENSNKKMDYKIFIPKEGYGFSNINRDKLIPPKFNEASIYLDREASVSLTMIYL